MTRAHVSAALRRMRLPVVAEDAHGILVRRCRGIPPPLHAWVEEVWRLHSGGGIAGNAGQWWLRPRSSTTPGEALGPFTSQRALTKALRAWRRWEDGAP